MSVAVARRRIGAHHVGVAPAVRVPQMRALAARQHDGKRRIVVRAIAALQLDRVHGTSPHCCGRITARIADCIYVAAAARAAGIKGLSWPVGAARGLPPPETPRLTVW